MAASLHRSRPIPVVGKNVKRYFIAACRIFERNNLLCHLKILLSLWITSEREAHGTASEKKRKNANKWAIEIISNVDSVENNDIERSLELSIDVHKKWIANAKP